MNEHAEIKFLDTHLNIIPNTHEPYIRPNSILRYFNANSNHPPSVKKALVCNITYRISNLSTNKEIFNNHINKYIQALMKPSYRINDNFKYTLRESINRILINKEQ